MTANEADGTVLVTGCSSGLGQEIARGLRDRGFGVLATARHQEDIARLNEDGLQALPLDLTQAESRQAAAEEALQRTDGKIFAIVNNAGIGLFAAMEDIPTACFRKVVETNCLGPHDLTRRLLPALREQGTGRIIQISSALTFIGLPFRGPYVASKMALEGWTDALRRELVGSGIHVSLIEAGPVATPFNHKAVALTKKSIDTDRSLHRDSYRAILASMAGRSAPGPPMATPEDVVKKVVLALTRRRPRPRYYVGLTPRAFCLLSRVLPDWAQDRLARAIDSVRSPH